MRDLGQLDPMMPSSPGVVGAFRCGLCHSARVMPLLEREGDTLLVVIVCERCGNRLAFEIAKEAA